MKEEFYLEALELLEDAEAALLKIFDPQEDFDSNYNIVFRALHSLKGGAGMFELFKLEKFIHTVEEYLINCKKSLAHADVDYLLQNIDAIRGYIDSGNLQSVQNDVKKEKSFCLGRICLVEDEDALRTSIYLNLKELGYQVDCFSNGADAFEYLLEYDCDLLITDIKMPIMDGLTLFSSLKTKGKSVPTIFMSGKVSKKDVIENLNTGLINYVEKPFDTVTIASLISSVMASSQLKKSLESVLETNLALLSTCEKGLSQLHGDQANQIKKAVRDIMDIRRSL